MLELLKWMLVFTELQSDPELNGINVHEKLKSKLKLINDEEYYNLVNYDTDKLYINRPLVYETCNEQYDIDLFGFIAKFGFVDIFKSLLEHEAYENKITVQEAAHQNRGFRGSPVIHLAAEEGQLNIIKYLAQLDESNLFIIDRDGNSLLQTAAYNDKMNIVRYLVEERHFDVNETNVNGCTASHKAAEGGSLDTLKYLERKGADLTAVDKEGLALLHYAAGRGKLEVIKYLTEVKNHNVNATTKNSEGLLHFAAGGGHLDAVKYLLDHSTNVEKSNREGFRALHFAVQESHLDLVKYLINEAQADINAVTIEGDTVLHIAVHITANMDLLRFLADEKNMSIYVRNNKGNTPMHKCAGSVGSIEIMKYFVEEKAANIFTHNNEGKTILQLAINRFYEYNTDFLDYLYSDKVGKYVITNLLEVITLFNEIASDPTLNDSNVNMKIEDRLKLINNVSISQHGLINNEGASVMNQRFAYNVNNNKATASAIEYYNSIEFSARYGYLAILKHLIQNVAREGSITTKEAVTKIIADNNRNREGSLLHLAVSGGHLDITKYLIVENGVNPMIEDYKTNTPLHLAASNNKMDIIQFLVEDQHVDIKETNRNYLSALHCAAAKGHLNVLKYLYDKISNIPLENSGWSLLHHAANNGHLAVVKYLIEEKKWDCKICCSSCLETPLQCAVQEGHLDIVRYILDRSTDLSEFNFNFHDTALHVAAREGKLDIVKYLVDEKGMSIYVGNINNDTPFEESTRRPLDDKVKIMKYFLEEKHADLSSLDKSGAKMIVYSMYSENIYLIKYLLTRNIDVNIDYYGGKTILYDAIKLRKLEYVKLLIEEGGANVHVVDEKERSILHYACDYEDIAILKYLVGEKKMNVSAVDAEKRTPLHYAVRRGNLEIVRYLLEHGAETLPRDALGFTPIDIAQTCANFKNIVEYLKNFKSM